MSTFVSVIKLPSFTFFLVNLAAWEPNRLFPRPELDLDLLLKRDVCAGKLKFGALFAKNDGGEEVPLKLLNLFLGFVLFRLYKFINTRR